jgi:hypothetical protein
VVNKFKTKSVKEQVQDHVFFDHHAGYADRLIKEKKPEILKNWSSSSPSPEAHLYAMNKITGSEFKFEKYKVDDSMEEFLIGKKVALVGPSKSIEGNELGNLIDSYDIVIRANQHYELPEDEVVDYGSRTDAIVTCLNQATFIELNNNVDFLEKIKYLVGGNLLMWERKNVVANCSDLICKYHLPTDGEILALDKKVGTICNTGFMGIILLLHYSIKELYVAGFDFYNFAEDNPKKEDVYNSSYEDSSTKYHGDLRLDIHDQMKQIEYFKILLRDNSNIVLDPVLQEYFNENY